MTIYHNHHIIPRYMGGSNDPSNIIKLTVEEHAEAHRKLYEEYGHWQDKIAWQCLSGQIASAEVHHKILKERTGSNNPNYGNTWSEKQRAAHRKAHLGKKRSAETRRRMSESAKNRKVDYSYRKDPEYRRRMSESVKKAKSSSGIRLR